MLSIAAILRRKIPETLRRSDGSVRRLFSQSSASDSMGENGEKDPNKVEIVGETGGVFLKMEKRPGGKPVV